MRYLVMECHLSYAVVMDSQGRILKVPNLGYAVGQQLDEVLSFPPTRKRRRWPFLLAAACLCLLVLVGWQFLFIPYGRVRMVINPDLLITVNRLDRVIRVEGCNDDGNTLLAGYVPRGGSLESVTADLADRALGLGFLDPGGTILLIVSSEDKNWQAAAQNQLILSLTDHLDHQVTITVEGTQEAEPPQIDSPPPAAPAEPSPPMEQSPAISPSSPLPQAEDDDDDQHGNDHEVEHNNQHKEHDDEDWDD